MRYSGRHFARPVLKEGGQPPAILIHGPTASGKTGLSIALASFIDGEVINADAMQVYADLRVITAQPTLQERGEVPHHLFGFVDPAERFSTGKWLEATRTTIADVWARGKVPIIVGGTGLHLHVLTEGLAEIPPIPEECRAEAKAVYETGGMPALRAAVQKIDPIAHARIQDGDRQRLLRALEVWLATGRPMSGFQDTRPAPLAPGQWLGIALHPHRDSIYARIDLRFEAMVQGGAVEEVKALSMRELASDLPAMRAHGVPWLLAHLRGLMSLKDAVNLSKRDTRRYAKRQYTWIGRQFPHWVRVPLESTESRLRVISSLYAQVDVG